MTEKEKFKARGQLLILWEGKARQFKAAIEVLWSQLDNSWTDRAGNEQYVNRYHEPCLFLMGVCLECFVKGILVNNNKELVSQDKIDNSLANHDILEHLKNSEIKLTGNEQEFVKKVSEYVVWMGKYPIPKKSNTLLNPQFRGKENWNLNKSDIEVFLSVYKKIEDALK